MTKMKKNLYWVGKNLREKVTRDCEESILTCTTLRWGTWQSVYENDRNVVTVTTNRVADAIEASHMVKSSSAVKQNP